MFRNREFRWLSILFSLIAAVSIILGFTINSAAGFLVVVTTTSFGISFLVFTKDRYNRIKRISSQIDLVLHNPDHLYISESDEGEFSILHSEISKMTLCIQKQNDALRREKEHLADSLADIAHQLRTPLTSINLVLPLLANASNKDERKTLLREIEELLVQMDWLITSLLKLARLDAGIVMFQREQINVNDLIRGALRPFLIPMELHSVNAQMDLPKEINIWGDADWLSEAIQNILKNCMEGAGEHGQIEIVCKNTPLFTEINIHDSGTGFKKEDLPCLFDRFYRGTKSNTTGFGIGLSLCKTIIKRQGGTITAKNHPKGGAMFSIRFPK